MSGRKFTQVWDAEKFARTVRRIWPSQPGFWLARETGLPARTVEKHLRGEARPNADAVLAYLTSASVGAALRRRLLE